MLIASLFLLWIIVILLVVAVIALTRQVRLLQDRDMPIGRQHTMVEEKKAR